MMVRQGQVQDGTSAVRAPVFVNCLRRLCLLQGNAEPCLVCRLCYLMAYTASAWLLAKAEPSYVPTACQGRAPYS